MNLIIEKGIAFNPQPKCFAVGEENNALNMASERHAQYMASHETQGHQNWNARKTRVERATGLRCEEVCAESWPNQNEEKAASEMFKSWVSSQGHWGIIDSANCKMYGFAMEKGKNGIWYGCGIIGT